jgi:hypothetical protein
MHVHKIQWSLTEGHSKVVLECQFPQTFTMVKEWAEMAVPQLVVTPMPWYILAESSF